MQVPFFFLHITGAGLALPGAAGIGCDTGTADIVPKNEKLVLKYYSISAIPDPLPPCLPIGLSAHDSPASDSNLCLVLVNRGGGCVGQDCGGMGG